MAKYLEKKKKYTEDEILDLLWSSFVGDEVYVHEMNFREKRIVRKMVKENRKVALVYAGYGNWDSSMKKYANDVEIAKAYVSCNVSAYKKLPKQMQENKEIALIRAKKGWPYCSWNSFPDSIKKDIDVMKAYCEAKSVWVSYPGMYDDAKTNPEIAKYLEEQENKMKPTKEKTEMVKETAKKVEKNEDAKEEVSINHYDMMKKYSQQTRLSKDEVIEKLENQNISTEIINKPKFDENDVEIEK